MIDVEDAAARAKYRPRLSLRLLTWLSGLLMVLAYWMPGAFGEGTALLYLVANLPTPVFLAPSGLLLLIASIRRRWLVAVYNAVLLTLGYSLLLEWPHSYQAGFPPNLRVMTLNTMRGQMGGEKIVALIRKNAPDVITLLDVVDVQLNGDLPALLNRDLPQYRFHQSGQMLVASKLPIIRSENHHLYGALPTRPVLRCDIQVGETLVSIFAVHLSRPNLFYLQDGPFRFAEELRMSAERRRIQLDQLSGFAFIPERDTLICGDFNMPPRSPEYKRFSGFHNDAFAEYGEGLGYTFRHPLPLMRIDYIWASDASPQRCWTDGYGVADHKAVIADFRVFQPSKR